MRIISPKIIVYNQHGLKLATYNNDVLTLRYHYKVDIALVSAYVYSEKLVIYPWRVGSPQNKLICELKLMLVGVVLTRF